MAAAELDERKLARLLNLRYNSAIRDARDDPGPIATARSNFVRFQKYSYRTYRI